MPFASMTDEDVHAFYQLLDEYFESRKDMFAGWANANAQSSASAPAARRATPSSTGGGRMMAPAAPPIQTAYRPTTPQSPAVPAAGGPSVPAPPAPRNTQPTNKYGITVPSMDDFKDPRFQSGFKFAGSAMSAAGGLLNKHVLGGQNHHGQQGTPQEQAAVAAPPPKANKPTPFKANSLARSTATPPPPPAPASNRGIGTCTAQFDYNSGEASDLTFREGDRIDIIAKESADWWKGSLHGREGLFPASYVQED